MILKLYLIIIFLILFLRVIVNVIQISFRILYKKRTLIFRIFTSISLLANKSLTISKFSFSTALNNAVL